MASRGRVAVLSHMQFPFLDLEKSQAKFRAKPYRRMACPGDPRLERLHNIFNIEGVRGVLAERCAPRLLGQIRSRRRWYPSQQGLCRLGSRGTSRWSNNAELFRNLMRLKRGTWLQVWKGWEQHLQESGRVVLAQAPATDAKREESGHSIAGTEAQS